MNVVNIESSDEDQGKGDMRTCINRKSPPASFMTSSCHSKNPTSSPVSTAHIMRQNAEYLSIPKIWPVSRAGKNSHDMNALLRHFLTFESSFWRPQSTSIFVKFGGMRMPPAPYIQSIDYQRTAMSAKDRFKLMTHLIGTFSVFKDMYSMSAPSQGVGACQTANA